MLLMRPVVFFVLCILWRTGNTLFFQCNFSNNRFWNYLQIDWSNVSSLVDSAIGAGILLVILSLVK